MNWKALLTIVVTYVLPILHPGLAAAAPFILHGIQTAEDLGGTGAQKLASVVDLVNTGVATTNATAGRVVIDPALVAATSAAAISAAVDITNLIVKTPVPDAAKVAPVVQ